MKIIYQTIAMIGLFMMIAVTAHAVDVAKPADMPMKGMGMHQGGMGGMMAGMTDEQKDKHMRSMQEHMLKMHDLSNQILTEKDPTKKEQLKTEQLQLMKAHHAEMMERHHEMKDSKMEH